jgi:hypothetical protein
MSKWQVSTTFGEDLGVWEGDDQKEALQAMASAAGFFDYAEACSEGHFDDSTVIVEAA